MVGISSYDRHHYSIWNEASEDNEESDTTKSGMKGKFKKKCITNLPTRIENRQKRDKKTHAFQLFYKQADTLGFFI